MQEGFEYKFVENGETIRVRVHGSDQSAPIRTNAYDNWVVRVQKGKKYMDSSGTFHPPGISNPNSEFYDEILIDDTHIPRRRGIGGAHNKVEFEKNTVNIVNKVEHPTMKGVEKVTYQIPSVDAQTGQITDWKAKTFDKTIYAPDIISTDKYMSLGKEAANDAVSKGKLGREWTGYYSEGNVWRGYTDKNSNVTSFFSEI